MESYDLDITINLILGCFIWMRHHCLLIGFHSWPTFCPWGFSSPLCVSSHVSNCAVKEGGGTVRLWVCWLDRCTNSNYPPLWERQGVTDMLNSPCHFSPISNHLPTPLFYISFDCRQGALSAYTSAHLLIFIQMDGLSSLRFGRVMRRFTYR